MPRFSGCWTRLPSVKNAILNSFPWDHANYGMDEHWVRCYPYEQEVALGEAAHLRVEITEPFI